MCYICELKRKATIKGDFEMLDSLEAISGLLGDIKLSEDPFLDVVTTMIMEFTKVLDFPFIPMEKKAEFARRFAELETDMTIAAGFELKDKSDEGRNNSIEGTIELVMSKLENWDERKKAKANEDLPEHLQELVDGLRAKGAKVQVEQINIDNIDDLFKEIMNHNNIH